MKRLALLLALALLAASRSAYASRALHVTVAGCEQLPELEVQRLAELELATVAGGESNEGAATAEIVCSGDEALILASAPGTTRSLNRRLVLASELEGRTRVAAIAVAQLVRALDWLPNEPSLPPPIAPPQRKPPTSDRHPWQRPGTRVELEAAGGLRLRDFQSSFWSRRLSLASDYRVSPGWALGIGMAFERGTAERDPGDVRAQLLTAGARLKLEPWPKRRLGMVARADVGVAHLSLEGRNTRPEVNGAEISGLGVDAALAVGPLLRIGSFGVALLGEGGIASFGGTGLVVRNTPIDMNGAWLGAQLAARVEL